MNNLFQRWSISLLLVLVLAACRKEATPVVPPIEEPTTTNTPTEENRKADQQLVEAQAIFAQVLGTSLVETAKSTTYLATNIQPPCPSISLVQQGVNCGDDDLITIDFDASCPLSGGSTMSGVLSIRSFAPCEMVGGNELPSLLASSQNEKMILTFTSVTFNGYTIEYQQGTNSGGIFFWNGGNLTEPYFVFIFGTGDEVKVTHPNGIDYSQFIPFTAIPSIEIRPSDPMISLDVDELDAAEYQVKLLAQLDNQNQLVDYWRVQTYEGGSSMPTNDNFLITEINEDLLMTPQCNAIKGGTLQLRSILSSPSNALIKKEYSYGYQENDADDLVECDPDNPTPADACEDYVWICDFDVNGGCDKCDLVQCFFTN